MAPTRNDYKVGITGFCYDDNSSYLRGAADAPQRIREALFCPSSNMWSETGVDVGQSAFLFDNGDYFPGTSTDPVAAIGEPVEALLEKGIRPISLGGDHAVTYPIVKAVARYFPNLNILHVDAHPDLYDNFEGSRLSHASLFARIMEERLASRLVQVGIRTINAHQREQADRFGVEVVEMKSWRDDLEITFDAPVYVTIDCDGFDPAFAPGVSHPEPGGLSSRQVIDLIHRMKGRVIGADIVEYNPEMDVRNITAMLCAKLMKELSARIAADY